MVIGLPGKFLSPVFESVDGSSFLAMGDSAGCLPVFMPFLFPFATGSWFCRGGSWAASPEPRRRAVLFPGPLGGGKGLRSKSVGGDVCWGSFPGKAVFLFFFFLISPLSCLLGVAKSECNAQNYSNHLKGKLGKGPTAGSQSAARGERHNHSKILSPS